MAEVVSIGPSISQEDFSNFHAAHFSSTSVQYFADKFLGPMEDEEYADEEDDGLGYYEDGVKRTLTDEQIAIFRHSEIEALLRDRRHAEEAEEDGYESPGIEAKEPLIPQSMPAHETSPTKDGELLAEDGELEDGEVDDGLSTPQATTPQNSHHQNNKKNKRKKNKSAKNSDRQPQRKGFFRQNVKPDLRKRTWDKVETGPANLDYDEDPSGGLIFNPAAQRRRISYDDD